MSVHTLLAIAMLCPLGLYRLQPRRQTTQLVWQLADHERTAQGERGGRGREGGRERDREREGGRAGRESGEKPKEVLCRNKHNWRAESQSARFIQAASTMPCSFGGAGLTWALYARSLRLF